MAQDSDHLKGLLLTGAGVLVLSPDALLIRLLELDVWTLLFWRGLGIALVVGVIPLLRRRIGPQRAWRGLGLSGLGVAFFFPLGITLFVMGISTTAPANVLVIIASAPLFAALFGWIVTREGVDRSTLLAIVAAMAGVAITVSGSARTADLLGNLAAIGCAISIALNFTILRRTRHLDMTAAFALGGVCLVLVAAIAAPTVTVAAPKLPYLIALCAVVQPVSFMLIMRGPRYLPAAEVSLIMLLETAFGPVWVWLVLADRPSPQAFLGGVIILATITLHSLIRLRSHRGRLAAVSQQTSSSR